MLKISNIRLEIDEKLSADHISRASGIKSNNIISFKLAKKSVDARKKNDIHYNCSVVASVVGESNYLKNKNVAKYKEYHIEIPQNVRLKNRPLIVGLGPAGLFCALYLAYAGCKPIVIERGDTVDNRIKAVKNFWENGILDKNTNVQFGEGGAGAFSDGKLTTGVNDERMQFIKEQLVQFGASEDILYLAKPHIGTDKLCIAVKNIRNRIIELGGEFLFNTKLVDFSIENKSIKAAVCRNSRNDFSIFCDSIILAVGHSARDTFELLKEKGIQMQRKTFSIGGRIEHLQSEIGKSQYGDEYEKLPPADYKLSVKTMDERGVYTFCMCPGGYVVASSSEENTVVTNGMSYYARDGKNANSAVLVTVNPEDIEGDDVLGGVYLQRRIEEKAFIAGGSDYSAPVQKVGDFLNKKKSDCFGRIIPEYKPGTRFASIDSILPQFVADAMREALPMLDRKLKGFADSDAVITVPETRSSSPVRILRNSESLMSEVKGLYPCGEGAGYAGGIMSAALDGIKCAEALIKNNTR